MENSSVDYGIMAGQRLMLGFDGVELNDELKHIIGDIHACGIILFSRNIESPEQVTALCAACQDYAQACGLPPLFIAVDQEGGVVARLKPPFTMFRGNGFINSAAEATTFAAITARELLQVGINMNFAPVLDIVPQGVDGIMQARVFKGDAQTVSLLGNQIIHTLQEKGVMAVAKHFPGIGRTVKDSHFHLPVLDIDLASLWQSDLIPFADAKERGVAGIMLSHILYPQLDNKWQASLSPVVAGTLLRDQMGYDGLVMTDDLDMKAIDKDMATCIQQILRCRIDMALICHKGPNIDKAFNEILQRLKQDEDLYLMGKKSLERILRAKKKYVPV